MFLHLSVILFQWGVYPRMQCAGCVTRGVCDWSVCVCVCVCVCETRGFVTGGCDRGCTPPLTNGRLHPTGMLSCYCNDIYCLYSYILVTGRERLIRIRLI